MPAATAADLNYDVTLDELEKLLCAVAAGAPLNRFGATSYSNCRDRLLASPLRRTLPGFLLQCMSLTRFKDFITLYDGDIDMRQRFIRWAVEPCHSLAPKAQQDELARARTSQSNHWML